MFAVGRCVIRFPRAAKETEADMTALIGKTALFEPLSSLEDSARFLYSRSCVVDRTIRFSLLWIQQQYFCTQQGHQPYV
jgi:hypothetical protein